MSKGAYSVNNTYVGPSKDGSFKSCICAMLVFLAICGIIILTTSLVSKNSGGKKQNYLNNNDTGYASEQKSNNQTTKKPSEIDVTTFKPLNKTENNENLDPTTEKDVELIIPNEGLDKQSKNNNQTIGKIQQTTIIPNEPPNIDNKGKLFDIITTETIQTTTILSDKIKSIDSEVIKTSTERELPNKIESTTIQNKYSTPLHLNFKNDSILLTNSTTTTKNNKFLLTTAISAEKVTEIPEKYENITTVNSRKIEDFQTTEIHDSKIKNELTTVNSLGKNNDKFTTINVTESSNDRSTEIPKKFENITTVSSVKIENFQTTEMNDSEMKNELTTIISLSKNNKKFTTTESSNGRSIEIPEKFENFTTIKDEITTEMNEAKIMNEFTTIFSRIQEKLTTIKYENISSRKPTTIENFGSTTMKNREVTTIDNFTPTTIKNRDLTTMASLETSTLSDNTTIILENTTNNNNAVTEKPISDEITTLREPILDPDETSSPIKYTSAPQSHQLLPNIVDKCGSNCRGTGARILAKMNHSADACEDFYDFSCGGDSEDSPKDNWKRISSEMDHINAQSPGELKIFQKFYTSCVDFHNNFDYDRRLEDARYILGSVGQPEEAEMDDGKSALTELLTRLLLHDSSPLFDISVDVDKDTQYFVFQMNIGKRFSTFEEKYSSLPSKKKCIDLAKKKYSFSNSFFNFIPLNEMYNTFSDCQKNELYKNETLEKALELFGLYGYLDESLSHIRSIIDKYQSFSSRAMIRKDILTKNFQVKKVSEINLQYPLIDWKKLFSNLVGKEVHDDDRVQIYFADFFQELFNNKQLLTHVQYYDVIISMFAYDLYTNFILPIPEIIPEEYCLHYSSDLMKEIASFLYLKSINEKDIEGDLKRIEELFNKMKIKLNDLINEAEWVDVASRLSMIKKLNGIELDAWNKSLIWKNFTLVQQRMESVEGINGNYSEISLNLIKRNRKLLYNMWDTMAYTDKNVWWHILTPYSKYPTSIYSLNKIFVPVEMLLTNSDSMPRYISLAKLGFNLAKTIGLHFDFTGHKYKVGLSDKSNLAYEESKICSYFTYNKKTEMEYDGKNVKFQLTNTSFMLSINERFAEDMAIHLLTEISNEDVKDYQLSWIASNTDLSKDYSREKMFFVAIGQEHCKRSSWDDFLIDLFENEHLTPMFILNNALSHSELFNDVFDCKQGARMNAQYKCKAFPLYDEPEDYDEK